MVLIHCTLQVIIQEFETDWKTFVTGQSYQDIPCICTHSSPCCCGYQFDYIYFHIFSPYLLAVFTLAILFLSQFCCKNVWFDSYGISFQLRNFSPFFSVILIAAVTNLLLCYYNFQNAYKEIKEMIFKYRQKHRPQNCSVDTGEEDSFPEDLFWSVIDDHRVLPIMPEFYRMLSKMALILILVFFAFCSAILFSDPRNFEPAHLTINFFATGAIAGLVFKGMTIGKRFTGARKQKIEKQIEKAVISFYGPRREEVRITYNHLNTHV